MSKKEIRRTKDFQKKLSSNGITLLALIITIIILIILAAVTINFAFGANSLITRAQKTKIITSIANVKETLRLEQGEKIIEGINLTPETLLADGRVKRTVQQGEDGKEYGDNIEEKILEDETQIRFANKAFSEYVSKISGATEEMKFEWMKKQTSLTIADSSVDSLEDLVFFPNLTSLTLGEYGSNIPNITTMDGIENCNKLTSLSILGGPDKDYSAVAFLNNLKIFSKRGGNDYENILKYLEKCNNLEEVTLASLKITDMSKVSKLKNLKSLNMTNNQISKIEGLESMKNLGTLGLSDNYITKIEGLENLTNLKRLYLDNNNVEDITPLSANTSLTLLSLLGNSQIDGNRSNYTGERLEALNKIGEILDRGGTINY